MEKKRNKQKRLFIRGKGRDQRKKKYWGGEKLKQFNGKLISWHCKGWSAAKYWDLEFRSPGVTMTSVHLVKQTLSCSRAQPQVDSLIGV